MSTNKARPQREQGLTLIELIVFIVLVSIAVLAVLRVLSVNVRSSADPQMRKQALALAEGFLEEVQLARFTYCEPTLDALADDPAARPNPAACSTAEVAGQEAGGVGRPYDNVSDYVSKFSVAESAFNNVAGDLLDAAGNKLVLPGYTVKLTITPENLNGINSGSTPATMEVLRITVSVSYNNGNDNVTLDGYRTRYAPHAVP